MSDRIFILSPGSFAPGVGLWGAGGAQGDDKQNRMQVKFSS